MKTTNYKLGISLIAVLMFMLAATTASIVVFRWLGQENFLSGVRLKMSESYRASQAGLEAAQGWTANKAADVGIMIRTYELNNKEPVRVTNLLGGITQSSKQQNFEVYLTGVETPSSGPYKLKFLSVGTARDGSKYSQVGIFDVEGLYRMALEPIAGKSIIVGGGKVPAYFGGFGSGTQGNFESGYIIGDMRGSQGISSTGDMMVTGTVEVASGMRIGCPTGTNMNTPYPSNYNDIIASDPEAYGNFYVKEDLISQSIMICGNAYVGGDFINNSGGITIWGNLYVEGNLISTNSLKVYGNVTVNGNIEFENLLDIKGNLLMPNPGQIITMKNANNVTKPAIVWWNTTGSNCYSTGTNRCNQFTPNTWGTIQPMGGDPLSYLGNQITTEKVNGKYIINDPIMTGFASENWESLAIPAGCSALLGFASSSVITLNASTNSTNLMNAINNCYNTAGNWTGSDGSKWLVLRFDWQQSVNNFRDRIFGNGIPGGGNFIIIITNKPNCPMELPMTTTNTNVLLYFKEGTAANADIKIDRPVQGYARNYFIYSKGDIAKIDGNQYLTGNLFMADGKSVGAMQDPDIQSNERLFDALKSAGAIRYNEASCEGTVGGCNYDEQGSSSSEEVPGTIHGIDGDINNDPSTSYVPAIPYLKVKLQSQYASEENLAASPPPSVRQAILTMPRVVYLPVGENNPIISTADLAKYINVLYLNGATDPSATRAAKQTATASKMQSNCGNVIKSKNPETGIYACTIKENAPNCTDAALCTNAFYVVMGMQALSTIPPESDAKIDDSSDSNDSSSSSSSSSSTPPEPPTAAGLTCYASNTVGVGANIKDVVTVICQYDDGTIDVLDLPLSSYEARTFGSGTLGNSASLGTGTYQVKVTPPSTCPTTPSGSVTCADSLFVVGINCSFSNIGSGPFAKGEAIKGPEIYCHAMSTFSSSYKMPANLDFAVFSSNQPGTSIGNVNERGWLSDNGYAYFASGPVNSAHQITVSNVECDSAYISGGRKRKVNANGLAATCGGSPPPFTITDPACTSVTGGNYSTGEPIAISVNCKTGEPMTNMVFSSPGFVNNGTGGVFTSAGSKNIRLNSGECWERPISGLDIDCGTVVISASSQTSECAYNPEWCNYIPFEQVVKLSQSYSGQGTGFDVGVGGKCIFTTSLSSLRMANNSGGSSYKVNGVTNGPDGGRCGREGSDSWGQQPCATAYSQVQKADNGYYIYIAPGWAGDFVSFGGEPVCDGSGTTDPPPSDDCITRPTATVPPPDACLAEGGKCYKCLNDCNQDWLWNSTSNPVTSTYFFQEITCPSGNSVQATCTNLPSTGTVGTAITAPTTNCGSTSIVTSRTWQVNGVTNNNFWNADGHNTPGTYSISATITNVNANDCVGQVVNCGSITINAAPQTPTAACTVNKTNVSQGENITLVPSCSSGTLDKSGVTISNNVVSTNWQSTDNVHFSGSAATGSQTISLTGIKCGSTTGLTANCPSITVSKPTCAIATQTVNSGATLTTAPSLNCGGAVITSPSFSTPTSGCTWNGSGNSGSFTRTSSGNCALTLNGLTCGDNSISLINQSCTGGTVTVNVGGGGLTISGSMSIPAGTHTVNNTISCAGACTNGACSTTGIGGSCAASPGYHCATLNFTSGSTITVSNGDLRIDNCQ